MVKRGPGKKYPGTGTVSASSSEHAANAKKSTEEMTETTRNAEGQAETSCFANWHLCREVFCNLCRTMKYSNLHLKQFYFVLLCLGPLRDSSYDSTLGDSVASQVIYSSKDPRICFVFPLWWKTPPSLLLTGGANDRSSISARILFEQCPYP